MEAHEQQKFVDDVVSAAERIDLEDMLQSSMRAQDFGSALATDPEIEGAQKQAHALISGEPRQATPLPRALLRVQ